jgi:MYXO-CTERM domain-containing protein
MWRTRIAFGGALVVALLWGDAARAFCGFYVSGADTKLFNNATQVALMREGTRTVLSMQNNYQGPPSNFAMVVPVPVVLQKENVKTLPRTVFAKLDQLDAPRLVEYWEMDPCAPPEPEYRRAASGGARPPSPARGRAERDDLGVKIEAQFTVAEYEIVILSAKDASGLDTWLRREKYAIPEGSEPIFRPYVQSGSKFFVARVDASKVTFDPKGMATLSPLRFHYDAETFSLPVRLGLVNSSGVQDLIVHVLAKGQRFEVANYPNVTIPTNIDVSENARTSFGSFYAALFDKTIAQTPRAVVTEYAWDAGTCDPCPGPALDGNDLATLGADALPGVDAPRGRGFFPSGFVITRLHARYGKDTLGEDLVFRQAPPIVGGREVRPTADSLETGAKASSINNFQGRYAIRHPWAGPIECKSPIRNRWGGPPPGVVTSGAPQPAKDLAFVARDAKLASYVRSSIPELGIAAEGAPVSPASSVSPASPSPSAVDAPDASAGASPKAARGCAGCVTTPGSSGGTIGLGLAALVSLVRRRRRP